MTKYITSLVATLVLAAVPSTARADPFVIAGGTGSVLTFDFEGDRFRFAGHDFEIVTIHDAPENFGLVIPRIMAPSCSTCRAGDVVNTSFHTPGEVFLGLGDATIRGTTYSDVRLSGTLAFSVTPVAFPNATGDFVSLQAPFSFMGFVRGLSGDQEVFAADLIGRGRVFQPFVIGNDGVSYAWEEGRLDYWFGAAAEPVPEPATMLLLGTGLAGALAARRRKRRT